MKTFKIGRSIFGVVQRLSKNKSFELQAGKFPPNSTVAELRISLTRRMDHAGFEFAVDVIGFHVIAKIYDHRHWDYKGGRWENS